VFVVLIDQVLGALDDLARCASDRHLSHNRVPRIVPRCLMQSLARPLPRMN
jgi:hypothetical protein